MAYNAPSYPEILTVVRDFFSSLPPQLMVMDDYQTQPQGKLAQKPDVSVDEASEYTQVITESDLAPLSKRISELASARENANLFFYDRDLDREFSSVKEMLVIMDKDKAVTFLKACKVLLAMIRSSK